MIASKTWRDQIPLLVGVEVIVDFRFGDVPVVGDERAKQTAFLVLMVPVEGDLSSVCWSLSVA